MLHKNVPLGDQHPIHNWEVANAAGLTAVVVTASDIGKVAKQADTGDFYILASSNPVVWTNLTTPPAAPAADPYVLPAASATVLGGVKIGANITVDPDGTISAAAAGGGGATEDKTWILKKNTSSSGSYQLTTDMNDVNDTNTIVPGNFTSIGFKGIVVARSQAGNESAMFEVIGLLTRGADENNITLIGQSATKLTSTGANANTWSMGVQKDFLGRMRFNVAGDDVNASVHWVGVIRTINVKI